MTTRLWAKLTVEPAAVGGGGFKLDRVAVSAAEHGRHGLLVEEAADVVGAVRGVQLGVGGGIPSHNDADLRTLKLRLPCSRQGKKEGTPVLTPFGVTPADTSRCAENIRSEKRSSKLRRKA